MSVLMRASFRAAGVWSTIRLRLTVKRYAWGMALHGIRGITFDAGGTLIEPNPGVGAIYAEVAAKHGVTANPAELDARFRAVFKRMRPAPVDAVSEATERAFWTKLAHEVFSGIANDGTFDGMFPQLWNAFSEPGRWQLRPGAVETLSKLRARGFRLAILSNFDSRLHAVLAGLGITAMVDGVFISVDVGVAKPDPRIFDHAARTLGLEPCQLLHVGDSVMADAAGAVSAGWSAALLGGQFPDAVPIAELSEVPALLG
ncbi:MAG TPA: HAD-IA family hydrolase [Opitutaceae bacterium]|nr:HAD-IA family hydrolase [Opitutaceae bacterium]